MKVEDYLTHIDNPEDVPYLKRPLFDVNMRLFHGNYEYKNIVLHCCEHIKHLARTTLDGYKKPHGMSGANVGIPFNIIAHVVNRNMYNESVHVMINPRIIFKTKDTQITRTNCGSIRLKEPIFVERNSGVLVEWFDVTGQWKQGVFRKTNNGFTIQHEIDHNLGILITDREVKKDAEEK
jgi:peptide deformylase